MKSKAFIWVDNIFNIFWTYYHSLRYSIRIKEFSSRVKTLQGDLRRLV